MRKIIALGLFSLLFAPALFSQVRVEVLLDQEQYLPNESLPAKVRIHNQSGQTLVLGKDEGWLTFEVESEDGRVVKELKVPEVVEEFSVPSGSRANRIVDIAPCFELTRFGSYTVVATVKIPGWTESISSKRKTFYIMSGRNLQELTFGIPSDTKGRPETRKFILVEANHLKQISLYVRITDESGAQTMKIFPIGGMISFSQPEAQLDPWNNLHLLYQDGGRSFLYTVITPDGMILTRHTYDYTQSRPILAVGEENRITVKGGVRRVTPSDLPPPELSENTSKPPADILPDNVIGPGDAKKTRR